MDAPGARATPVRRPNESSNGEKMTRTASNISSTSSDILVAPGSKQPSKSDDPGPPLGTDASAWQLEQAPDGRLLVLRMSPYKLRAVVDGQAAAAATATAAPAPAAPAAPPTGAVVSSKFVDSNSREGDDYDKGPNARGTYSKEYTLRHPEIKWVHRGQGRYLPADEIKKEVNYYSLKRSRHSDTHEDAAYDVEDESQRADSAPASLKRSWTSQTDRLPRKRRALEDTFDDTLSTPPTYGLRHRIPEQRTPSTSESRPVRVARRAQLVPGIESLRRSALRAQDSFAIDDTSEDEVDDDDDDNDDDDDDIAEARKEPTYPKKYVDAHPEESFYHTGNGWYKKGTRLKDRTKSVHHDDLDTFSRPHEHDVSYSVDHEARRSIHKSELDKYPGKEFHHTGNGWYRFGPDPNGKRTSITIPLGDESDSMPAGGTVDKAYKETHPEIEWVHRGNGRYMRKSDVITEASPASDASTPAASGRRKSEPTYSREYVEARPDEPFYHTGNARYKRGIRPSARHSIAVEASEEDEDESTGLVDKAYVEAHPEQEFHHRGQGRYARGPRPAPARAREEATGPPEESEHDSTELFDTSYVNNHPHLNFYHKGQGRWARGLPPPGSHNKTAVRGPGATVAKEKLAEHRINEQEPLQAAVEAGPPLSALLTRAEGPEKYPNLQWHYRGGGKWARVTKQEWEHMNQDTSYYYRGAVASRYPGNYRTSKVNDGPEAQLEREAAAARFGTAGGRDTNGIFTAEKPKLRRRRRNQQHSLYGDGSGSWGNSNPQSEAPTPRPPLLEPHEDIIGPDDLPHIFRDNWSPLPSDEGDELDRRLRETFQALNTDKILASLTKHDPAVRPLENLKMIAENAAHALEFLQDEYLALDKITAPHAKIPRKQVKGGRVPADPQVFEDKKEAELYDYAYDPRKIGYQDPEAQRIIRDAEGRELRKRRTRPVAESTDTVPGWHFGDGFELSHKRASRQPQRFENITEPPRKRARTSNLNGAKAVSMTPERGATPSNNTTASAKGRELAGVLQSRVAGTQMPKRIRELRDESVVSVRSDGSTTTKARKGRPPGSKNLHKRRDAGIKKGPRKPKPPVMESIEQKLQGNKTSIVANGENVGRTGQQSGGSAASWAA